MRVPRGNLCPVRSTVLVVAVLAALFLFFDSLSSQLLSLRRPRRSPFLSYATTSDVASTDVYYHYEDSGRHFTNKANLSRIRSRRTEEDEFPADSATGSKARTGELELGQQFGTVPNLTSTEEFASEDSRDEEKFKENNSTIGAATPLKDDSSRNRAAGPAEAGFVVEDDERHGGLSTSDKESVTVLPQETPSEIAAPPKAAETSRKTPALKYDDLSSFQKVEYDLWRARSALRKVVLDQMNPSTNSVDGDRQSVPAGEPYGDVYRNAAIFRQSYLEMEKRFKVYTYEEGEEPLVHNGPCKEIYAVEGRFIQELQGDNPYVTDDPETAHVFFLPFSVAMMVTYLYTANSGDMSPLLRFVKDYVNVVSHKYPYWTRSGGADHFMLSCHDWGPHISRADSNLMTKAIRVLCNANISEGYVPAKDVSLPEIHLVGGEIPAELGGLPASERALLAFFAGAEHGPVRPELFKHWEGKDSDIHVHRQVPAEGMTYHTYMKSSKYCLCPGGYEVNSPRIVEAIYNDCVPVVIADNFVLPFSDVLDWKTFAVHVLEKDIPNLKTILEAIPMETYIQMQGRVKQVRHHFILNQPPERYDVFHMILHSVWLRRLNIRLIG